MSQIVCHILANWVKVLFCVTRTNPAAHLQPFFASVCLFIIFFLDAALYIRSGMLANRKEASPYGYLRDIHYSQCCPPLCNNLTLLLSQASWSLRLGSAIEETCKTNMAHLCPCPRYRQKTGEPQRYVPLLSSLIMSHLGGASCPGRLESGYMLTQCNVISWQIVPRKLTKLQ